MMERTKDELKLLQALPLEIKILKTQQRIREWYEYWGGSVYVGFSGGKDSTVLLHLVRSLYPDVPAVFADTGLEYPEIRKFAASKDNVTFVRPKMVFDEVIRTYGYPLVSKEVAEAIYYARRNITPTDRQTDRRLGLQGKRPIWNEQQWLDKIERIQTQRNLYQADGAYRAIPERQRENTTANGGTDVCSREPSRQPTERWRGAQPYTRVWWGQLELLGKRRIEDESGAKHFKNRGNAGNRNTAGVGLSAFNKEKWLPLAQQAPFRVAAYCCNVMKKSPLSRYQTKSKTKPFLGTMAEESRMRKQAWIRHGCNAFDSKKPTSNPLSFWTEQDVLAYIQREGLEYCSVYGDIVWQDKKGQIVLPDTPGAKLVTTGAYRTGCIFCGFGMHLEKGESRFQRLKRTHPKLYDYAIGGGTMDRQPGLSAGSPNGT